MVLGLSCCLHSSGFLAFSGFRFTVKQTGFVSFTGLGGALGFFFLRVVRAYFLSWRSLDSGWKLKALGYRVVGIRARDCHCGLLISEEFLLLSRIKIIISSPSIDVTSTDKSACNTKKIIQSYYTEPCSSIPLRCYGFRSLMNAIVAHLQSNVSID